MINPTRESIAKSYATLGLKLGSSFSDAMMEYRFLAATFHPDRAFSESVKEKTSEKLRELNEAKEILDAHFNGPQALHATGLDCICQPNPAPKPQAAASEKESAAKARPRKPQKSAAPATPPVAEPVVDTAWQTRMTGPFEQETAVSSELNDERLRWKATALVFALFLSLWAFSGISQAIIAPIREHHNAGLPYDPYHLPSDPHYGESKGFTS